MDKLLTSIMPLLILSLHYTKFCRFFLVSTKRTFPEMINAQKHEICVVSGEQWEVRLFEFNYQNVRSCGPWCE